MKGLIAAFSYLTVLFCTNVQATPITYFDLDFESPTHIAGNLPSVGPNSDQISRINFGSPEVKNDFGGFENQSLVFDTEGNRPSFFYDQIRFDLSKGSDRYLLEFDMVTNDFWASGSGQQFAVLLDVPTVRVLSFQSNSQITHYGGGIRERVIGNFFDDTLMKVMIGADIEKDLWSIYINSEQLFEGPLGAIDLRSIRFSFGLRSSLGSPTDFDSISIDNVRISNRAVIPEPSSVILMTLAILLLTGRLRNGGQIRDRPPFLRR